MPYLPINVDLTDRSLTIVGGGAVAERKALRLLAAGGLLTIISPYLTPQLQSLASTGKIQHQAREYRCGDLTGAFLVYAATSNRDVNRTVAEEARSHGIPVNCVDSPTQSTFTSPAACVRGDLVIAVSTGGKSPAFASWVKDTLEEQFGDEYSLVLELLGKIREKLLTVSEDSAYNKQLWDTLVQHNLPRLFRENRHDELDHLLNELFGPGFSLDDLEVAAKDRQ